ncbi:hypothetical protein Q9L58_006664 [Maublancomyces gigas]|uniref:Uncharacterized protein n=1 Tax=Discina gigas TaxID=1032678 RepID=A0ABR3GEM2_9PEZI
MSIVLSPTRPPRADFPLILDVDVLGSRVVGFYVHRDCSLVEVIFNAATTAFGTGPWPAILPSVIRGAVRSGPGGLRGWTSRWDQGMWEEIVELAGRESEVPTWKAVLSCPA